MFHRIAAAALSAAVLLSACDMPMTVMDDAGLETTATGGTLAFGEVASRCDRQAATLGTRIAATGGYALYDSRAGATGARPHFITGFSDGCPREFSAALAMFGDAATHAATRYGESSQGQPYTATDTAYETIKAGICGAAAGQPCGAAMNRLSANTAFLTAYRSFGGDGPWVDMLIHGGSIVAATTRD